MRAKLKPAGYVSWLIDYGQVHLKPNLEKVTFVDLLVTMIKLVSYVRTIKLVML